MAASGYKGAKRVRSETGIMASSKHKQGEMYEKWKKKSHREVGGFASEDSEDRYDNKPKPNVRVNTHVKEELRNKEQLQKLHKIRSKNALKNMPKEKRDSIRRKMKSTHNKSTSSKTSKTRGPKKF